MEGAMGMRGQQQLTEEYRVRNAGNVGRRVSGVR